MLETLNGTRQLASWCSTLPQTSESISKQTRTIQCRLRMLSRQSLYSKRPAVISLHMMSSAALGHALRSSCLYLQPEWRMLCSKSRICTVQYLIWRLWMLNSSIWPWFAPWDLNTQTLCPLWPCLLTLTRTRWKLHSRLRKSIIALIQTLSLFLQQTQHSLPHHLDVIASKTCLASSVRSLGTVNANAIHSRGQRSTTSQTRARRGRARNHRQLLPLPQALRMLLSTLAIQVFISLPLIPSHCSCSMLTMIGMQTQGPLLI